MEKDVFLSEALRKRIKDLAKSREYSMNKVALLSGVPYSTLSSFLTYRCNSMTIGTLYLLCNGLNVSLSEFFEDPLFDDL